MKRRFNLAWRLLFVVVFVISLGIAGAIPAMATSGPTSTVSLTSNLAGDTTNASIAISVGSNYIIHQISVTFPNGFSVNGASGSVTGISTPGVLDCFSRTATYTIDNPSNPGATANSFTMQLNNITNTSTAGNDYKVSVTVNWRSGDNYYDLGPQDSAAFSIIPNVPTKITLNSPADINVTQNDPRAAYIVTLRNAKDQAKPTESNQTVYLTTDSQTGKFYNASTGGNEITSVVVPAASSTASFFYYDEMPGDWTITASDASPADGNTGLKDATDVIKVINAIITNITINSPSAANPVYVKSGDTVTVDFNVTAGNASSPSGDIEILILKNNTIIGSSGFISYDFHDGNDNLHLNYPVHLYESITDGKYNVKVSAREPAGNPIWKVATETGAVVLDTTAPTLSNLSPADGSFTKDNTPDITADFGDTISPIDISSIVMTVDNLPVIPGFNEGVIAYTPIAPLLDGNHSVTLEVSDMSGNAATQARWSFSVDTTVPEVTQATATPMSINPNMATDVTFCAKVTDTNGSGVDTITINLSSLGGDQTQAMTDENSDGVYEYTWIGLTLAAEKDDYSLAITATDKAGNSNTLAAIPFTVVDTTDPVISTPVIDYPFDLSSCRSGDEIVISVTVTDNLGVKTVTADCNEFEEKVTLLDDGKDNDVAANDNIYTGVARVTYTTNGSYTVTITAEDIAQVTNEASNESLVLKVNNNLTGFKMNLNKGWNLVSLPLIATYSVEELSKVDGINQIRTFVYENDGLVEKVWTRDAAFDNLTEIVDGQGYWIESINDCSLTLIGTIGPEATEVPPAYAVHKGWNLIGFKSHIDAPAYEYLGTDIAGINAKTSQGIKFERLVTYLRGQFASLSSGDLEAYLEPGMGYWLALNGDSTIYPSISSYIPK